jgi:D-3-phosphoglycerate dehydrogenase
MTEPLVVYIGAQEHLPLVRNGLGEGFELVCVPPDADALLAHAKSAATILDASMKLRLPGSLLERFPHLRLMVTATTGADHIDKSHLDARGIPLLTLKGQIEVLRQVTPAAEHTWLLLMACARRLRPAIHHVEDGGWDRSLFPGVMLRGKTLGVVGCGRLGQWMARYASAFEMRVLGYDPALANWPAGIEQRDLPGLLKESDFVSLHVPLNDDTHQLIGRNELQIIKPGAILINTSRGAIVDEAALLEALKDGRVASIGFDVLADEPDLQRSELWQYARAHQQCIITPHIGGFSPDALAVVLRFTGERIRKFFHPAVQP